MYTNWTPPLFLLINENKQYKWNIWLYNTEHHYEDMHPEAEKPELDPEEVKFMIKKKKAFKEINVFFSVLLWWKVSVIKGFTQI